MSRGDSLARQLNLILMLETRQVIDVPDAAEQLECTARTVYRDLQVLERVGVPIYQERKGQRARRRRRQSVDGPTSGLVTGRGWRWSSSKEAARCVFARHG